VAWVNDVSGWNDIFRPMNTQKLMKTGFLNRMTCCRPSRSRAGMTLVEVVIAVAIAGLTVGGIVTGYIYCTTSAVKAELAQAANAKALQRVEEARSARWDVSGWPVVDELVATNFPDQIFSLDLPGTNSVGTSAIIRTTIAQISVTPPIRTIHVDCIWQFKGSEWVTNSIETIRSAD
jgi:prepilin-type N-terminal cleavage/methylation domain-containing protein